MFFMPCTDRQEGRSGGCPGSLSGVVPKDDLFPNLEWLPWGGVTCEEFVFHSQTAISFGAGGIGAAILRIGEY